MNISEKEKAALLAKLSQCGFLIYEADKNTDPYDKQLFTLKKIPTPTDDRANINDDQDLVDRTFIYFDDQDSALKKAAELIEWKFEEPKPAEPEEVPEYTFKVELNHNFGLGVRLVDLGIISAISPEDCDAQAKELAQKYLDEGDETKDKTWKELQAEVVARPYENE
jgi:hypothetical protein